MLVYLYFPSLDILCLQLFNMCSVSPVFLKKTGCELAVLFIYAPWVPWDKICYNQKRHKRGSLAWDNIKAICNGNSKHTQSAFIPSSKLSTEKFLSEDCTEDRSDIKIISTSVRNQFIDKYHLRSVTTELHLIHKTDSSSPSLSLIQTMGPEYKWAVMTV